MEQFSPDIIEHARVLSDLLKKEGHPTEIVLHTYGNTTITIGNLDKRSDIVYTVQCIDAYQELNGTYRSIRALRGTIDKLMFDDLKQYEYKEKGMPTCRKCLICKENNVVNMTTDLSKTIYEDSCLFCNERTCYSKFEYMDIIEGAIVKVFNFNVKIGTIVAHTI